MTTTKRVKCSGGCGTRTRNAAGICAKCASRAFIQNLIVPGSAQTSQATAQNGVSAPATAPATKRASKSRANGLTKLDNPFRPTSAQHAYFEILRDGKAHDYDTLNAKPKAKFPKDLVWFMLDYARKHPGCGFSVVKERETARMEVAK